MTEQSNFKTVTTEQANAYVNDLAEEQTERKFESSEEQAIYKKLRESVQFKKQLEEQMLKLQEQLKQGEAYLIKVIGKIEALGTLLAEFEDGRCHKASDVKPTATELAAVKDKC